MLINALKASPIYIWTGFSTLNLNYKRLRSTTFKLGVCYERHTHISLCVCYALQSTVCLYIDVCDPTDIGAASNSKLTYQSVSDLFCIV